MGGEKERAFWRTLVHWFFPSGSFLLSKWMELEGYLKELECFYWNKTAVTYGLDPEVDNNDVAAVLA